MSSNNEYMRKYMLNRYNERMNWARNKLGGKCIRCNSKNSLELDHIDPSTKIETIAKIWSYSKKNFESEVEKCQLLCTNCHILKSIENGDVLPRTTHGTLTMYKRHNCRCEKCKEKNNSYSREYKKKKKKDA
jgi:hypothetical protein